MMMRENTNDFFIGLFVLTSLDNRSRIVLYEDSGKSIAFL
jgi:hypothetical protein